MLGGVLDLLILVRDGGQKHTKSGAHGHCDFAFDDNPPFLDRIEKDAPTESIQRSIVYLICVEWALSLGHKANACG